MTHNGPHMDWQALVALGLVALAAAYLARRWWPGLRGLFAPAVAPLPPAGGTACASTLAPATSCNAGGGEGCGNCGHHATPAKDHRVHIVRRASSSGTGH